jgi:hypothetical protein
MSVNTGDIITAAQYNGLQSRVATIMGTGSGTDGYGQSLTSSQVNAGADITALDMDGLRTDINKANNHQLGSNASIGNIGVGEVVGAAASGTDPDNLDQTDKGFNDYDTAVGILETNKFLLDAGNSSVEAAISSTRTTAWNGVIEHVFTVTFADANQRRYFFNSGGEIRFSANLSGGNDPKGTDWATLLSNMGTIKFNYTQTSATGTGTGSNIGNNDLTTSYQTIFTKTGSGVYAENDYNIAAKRDSNSVLRFRVQFRDDDAGDQQSFGAGSGPIDEDVEGRITSSIQQLRATGSNVSVATPSYSNVSTL